MNQLVILGDLHFDIKEPFFSCQKEFCKWFLDQEFNKEENILIQLGDVYTHSNPNPKVHDLGIDFFSKMKFNKKYILTGNHDYNRTQNSYSTIPLQNISGVEIIYRPKRELIGNLNCLFLPFIYDKSEYSNNLSQKEFYENYKKNDGDIETNFVFHHLQDESINFGGNEGIDLSWTDGERVGGHIHIKNKNYLGTPYITRYDERGKESYILVIDLETKEKEYVKVSQFLDYEELNYENPKSDYLNRTKELLCYERIFDIIDAPSRQAAEDKFKGLYLREIRLKKNEEESNDSLSQEEKENKTLKDYFNGFCIKNKVSKDIQEKVINYIF
jgi:DNA repair exonuclease SbcCD nuclease subunit